MNWTFFRQADGDVYIAIEGIEGIAPSAEVRVRAGEGLHSLLATVLCAIVHGGCAEYIAIARKTTRVWLP